MKFGFVSKFAYALSWWLRLQDEGHDVMVWIEEKELKDVGDGLVPKAGTFDELVSWLSPGGIAVFDSSGLGPLADRCIRAGIPTVGGGSFCDKLEKDRAFGFKIAEDAGCKLPPYENFASFDACLAYARGMEDIPVYFKSDRYLDSDATHGSKNREDLVEYLEHIIRTYGGHGKCMLQEKIDGVAVSTQRWWNGRTWVGPYGVTLEHKKFLTGDLGPSTGCSLNAFYFEPDGYPKLARELGWENLTGAFLKHAAPPGLYDINAMVNEGEGYFLEWTPRFGYDSEMTSGRLFPDLGKMLATVALGTGEPIPRSDLAYSIRLGVPPYPWEHGRKADKHSCMGTYVKGDLGDLWSGDFIAYQEKVEDDRLVMAAAEGIVGLSYQDGDTLSKMHEKAVEFAKEKVEVPGLSFRNDGDKVLLEDAKLIKAAGFSTHRDLFE